MKARAKSCNDASHAKWTAFKDAIQDALPRGVSHETLRKLVNYFNKFDVDNNEAKTVSSVRDTLRMEQDAGIVDDAMVAAIDVVKLFEKKGGDWNLTKGEGHQGRKEIAMQVKVGSKALGAQALGHKYDKQKLLRDWYTAQVQKTQGQPAALNIALGGLTRLPKPRSLGPTAKIDEDIWTGAMSTAKVEFEQEQEVTDLDKLYSSICRVSRSLLAQELQRRAQRLYDYRAGKVFFKTKENWVMSNIW